MSNQLEEERQAMLELATADEELRRASVRWIVAAARYKYSYQFDWLGRPIVQHPQDIVAMQELIWRCRPQLVVETGVAHGGSLILSASILELLGGDRSVVGIDIEVREHNRRAIEHHPLAKRIELLEGPSTDPRIVARVAEVARGKESVLVVLDSNHTHAHVLRELELYSPLVTPGSYLVVMDTIIEDMPPGSFPHRPWDRGNSPKTAVHEFLRTTDRFEIDRDMNARLLITVAPDGYLRCLK